MATGATRASRAAAGALCALLSFAALAGPEEDYRAANTAFRSGDVVGAMSLLKRNAAQGHLPSMVLLGYMLEQSSLDGEAVQMYRKAADAGSVDGEVALAAMLAAGKGIRRDEAQALLLYEKAAERGNANAVNFLAQAYISRTMGLAPDKRDNARAVAALKRAAEGGYEPAAAELARAYTAGDFGLVPDPAEAARWQSKVTTPAGSRTAKGSR